MQKSEILEHIEDIALKSKENQVRLNALNLLLNYEISVEKEIEIKKKQEENDEKIKEKIKHLTEGLF